MIKYFKKTWLNNSYLNYEEITQKEYLNRTNNLLEYFHHLLNQNIEVFHPKFSYLVEKFIFFIKNIYIKIKESLVNEIPNTINKFTIIDDIYNYLSNYNKKYSEKENLHQIIQGNDEELEIINKITKYLTVLFFNLDYDYEDDKNSEEKILSNSNEISSQNNKINIDDSFVSEYENETNKIKDFENSIEINDDNIDSNNEEYYNIDIFFPQRNIKKKGKRTYNDLIGEKNELKNFQDNLILNRHISK